MKIVFDIGATNLRLASSEDAQTLKKVVVFPTPQNFEDALALLSKEVVNLSEGQPIETISGGIAAQLNKDKTEIIRAANLPDWSEKPFAKRLTEVFNCPVKIENDCALAAIAESHLGAGKEYQNLIYISVGTGIGGAWIVNKQLVEGSFSFDIGHQIIDPAGPLCPSCQVPGHLEGYKNQPDFNQKFAIGLYNTIMHWPADIVVLGGGYVLDHWRNENTEGVIAAELKQLTIHRPHDLPIRITTLGDEIGMHGALIL